MKARVSVILLYLVAARSLAFGLRYLMARSLMPYEEAFIELRAGDAPLKKLESRFAVVPC